MKDVRITWVLPVVRDDGVPLPVDEIESLEVFLSANLGVDFVSVATKLPSEVQEVFLPNQSPGNWIVRFVVEDTKGDFSADKDFAYSVPSDSAPGTVTNIEVIIT